MTVRKRKREGWRFLSRWRWWYVKVSPPRLPFFPSSRLCGESFLIKGRPSSEVPWSLRWRPDICGGWWLRLKKGADESLTTGQRRGEVVERPERHVRKKKSIKATLLVLNRWNLRADVSVSDPTHLFCTFGQKFWLILVETKNFRGTYRKYPDLKSPTTLCCVGKYHFNELWTPYKAIRVHVIRPGWWEWQACGGRRGFAGIRRNRTGGLEEQETVINWFPLKGGGWLYSFEGGVSQLLKSLHTVWKRIASQIWGGRRPFEAVGAHLDCVEQPINKITCVCVCV